MDRRMTIGLGLLAAVVGFYFWKKNQSTSDQQPQDQGPAEAAMQNYTAPPNVGVQTTVGNVVTNQGGVTSVQSRQAMPLPYNT